MNEPPRDGGTCLRRRISAGGQASYDNRPATTHTSGADESDSVCDCIKRRYSKAGLRATRENPSVEILDGSEVMNTRRSDSRAGRRSALLASGEWRRRVGLSLCPLLHDIESA